MFELNEKIVTNENKNKSERLDLIPRNRLQVTLAKLMFPDSEDVASEWLSKNAKAVSDIIDRAENVEIRNKALKGEFIEAAELLQQILLLKSLGEINLN